MKVKWMNLNNTVFVIETTARTFALLGCFIALNLSWSQAATFTPVLVSGEEAPGLPGFTVASLSQSKFNDAGQVYLAASIAGPGITSANNLVGYTGLPGGLSPLYQEGGPVPGFPEGTLFRSSTSPTNERIANDGRVTFNFPLQTNAGLGISAANDTATWIGVPGSISPLLREGDAAPGFAGGELLGNINGTAIVTSTNRILENQPLLVGVAGVAADNDSVIFYGTAPNTLAPIAREGSQAPDAPVGAVFDSVNGNARGNNILLTGNMRVGTGGVTASDDFAVWATNSLGELKIVGREGNDVQGLPGLIVPGTKIASFGQARMNSAGALIIESSNLLVDGVHATSASDRVILYGSADTGLQAITREGTQVLGLPVGINYANATGDSRISDAGQILLNSSLAGAVTTANDSAIFVGMPGDLTLVVREGDQAPGFDAGWQLRGWGSSDYNLNDNGLVALVTDASNDGGATGTTALFYWEPVSQALKLVVKEGDSLEVAPGMFREVSQLSIGFLGTSSQNFNNQNQLLISVRFTDNSEGIFIVQVPEPASALLVALGTLAFIGRRPRR